MGFPGKWARLLLTSLQAAGVAVLCPVVLVTALQNQEPPEIKSEETTPTFTIRAQRNEVQVRVVVRDAKGNAVGGLTKDDFRLTDNGKPQTVTVFTVESNKATPTAKPPAPAAAKSAEPSEAEPVLELPQRYVAFYFDDLVVAFEDMARVRTAAERYLDTSMQPTDRAGIFTSSGLGALDFTGDRAKLRQALANLQPHPRTIPAENDCPPLTPYEAYAIDELHDDIMLNIAMWEFVACACGGDAAHCPDPKTHAQMAARIAWQSDQDQSRQSLHVLQNLVRRLGALPGQRSILWLSQGFLTYDLRTDLDHLIDRAVREHVVISALDARGLWVDIMGGDASQSNVVPFHASGGASGLGMTNPSMLSQLAAYRRTGKEVNDDVMAQVAHDTGGVFVHNTNDYDGGFRRAGALPEFSYLLAFSPQDLKYDGKFHKLKVELVNAKGLSVQARNSYFAPNQALRLEDRAQQEIEDSVFAREEYHEFPVELETQYFKLNDTQARLSVTAHLDTRAVRFHKEGDRNRVSLRMVCAAFDRDGNLVDGSERNVDLLLRDATLAHLESAGLNIRGQLKISPGTYALRVVVYEIDSARMTALNRTVEIPY
jgi:VWFA-related protein